MITQTIRKAIAEHPERLGLTREAADGLRFAMKFGRTAVFFTVFAGQSPVAFAKFMRRPEHHRLAAAEHANLAELRRAAGPDLLRALPEPLFLLDPPAGPVLVLRFAPGAVMRDILTPDDGERASDWGALFDRVRAWLVAFQKHTASSSAPDRAAESASVFEACRALPAMRDIPAAFWDRCADDARRALGEAEWPAVWEHGDLYAGNLLVDRDYLLVLDWAGTARDALPVWDLYMFFSGFRFADAGTRDTPAWIETPARRTFYEEGWFGTLARDFLRGYCRAMDLDPQAVRRLYPLFLARECVAEQGGRADRRQHHHWDRLLALYARETERFLAGL